MYSFPNFNYSIVPCLVLTVASWPAYRFLRRQVRWSGIPISLRIFHSSLWECCICGLMAVVLQLLSYVQFFVSTWTAARQDSLSFTISWSLLTLMSIESVISSNHLILCHSLLLWPSIFTSIRVFSNESALRIRWPKYWSFSFSISPSNEYSGLISFNWLVWSPFSPRDSQESLQHDSSKALILWCSAFFMVQLSYPYMTTGKTIAFDYTKLFWQSDVSSF